MAVLLQNNACIVIRIMPIRTMAVLLSEQCPSEKCLYCYQNNAHQNNGCIVSEKIFYCIRTMAVLLSEQCPSEKWLYCYQNNAHQNNGCIVLEQYPYCIRTMAVVIRTMPIRKMAVLLSEQCPSEQWLYCFRTIPVLY
jgi:hypothetical protein